MEAKEPDAVSFLGLGTLWLMEDSRRLSGFPGAFNGRGDFSPFVPDSQPHALYYLSSCIFHVT